MPSWPIVGPSVSVVSLSTERVNWWRDKRPKICTDMAFKRERAGQGQRVSGRFGRPTVGGLYPEPAADRPWGPRAALQLNGEHREASHVFKLHQKLLRRMRKYITQTYWKALPLTGPCLAEALTVREKQCLTRVPPVAWNEKTLK